MTEKKKPAIIFTKFSPYTVTGIESIEDSLGKKIDVPPVVNLCRCGETKDKPFCDGSHCSKGIDSSKRPDRAEYKWKDYRGEKITVHFNLGVCSHDGSCVKMLPAVFNVNRRPWIMSDAATPEEIISVIHKCPSGALAYTVEGTTHKHTYNGAPKIRTQHKGQIELWGGIEIKDDQGTQPEAADHYVLCGCGCSKNKPFCTGEHLRKKSR